MAQEDVEAFERAIEAYNRRDIDAFLEAIDPEVELQGALQALLESEAKVYRGHEGVRQRVRDIEEALGDIRLELPEIHDLGDRMVAIGRLSARRTASGAETESPLRLCGRVEEWQGDSGFELPRSQRSPRSRRAAGVAKTSALRGKQEFCFHAKAEVTVRRCTQRVPHTFR